MKVAIFSDIHGNYQALECILNDIRKAKYDQVIYLGDAIAIGPDSKKCLELLKESNIKYILGNHELYFLRGTKIDDEMTLSDIEHQKWVASQLDNKDKKFLESCPLEYTLEIYNKKVRFSHFIIKDINKEYPFMEICELKNKDNWFKFSKDCDYYFVGHEHKSLILGSEEIASNLILVGSSGCTMDDQTSYIGLEIEEKTISLTKYYTKYNRQKFIEIINKKEYPEKEFLSKIFFNINNK